MERIKVTENFYLDEFIDPHTYLNSSDHGLSKIDTRLFAIAQRLRDYYGRSIKINSWWWYYLKYRYDIPNYRIIYRIERAKTISKWSGIRTDRCKIGATQSAHRIIHGGRGRAIDPKGDQNKLYQIVKENAEEFYHLGVRRLEDPSITSGWLHIDLLERNTQPDSIRVVDLSQATETITW
jgi:hypothetical protein